MKDLESNLVIKRHCNDDLEFVVKLSERMDWMEMKVCHCNDTRVTERSRAESIEVEPSELKYAFKMTLRKRMKSTILWILPGGRRCCLIG